MSTTPEPTIAPALLPPIKAAAFLAISPRKLWSLTKQNRIPHVRLGRSVRYPVAQLETWLAEQVEGGTQ